MLDVLFDLAGSLDGRWLATVVLTAMIIAVTAAVLASSTVLLSRRARIATILAIGTISTCGLWAAQSPDALSLFTSARSHLELASTLSALMIAIAFLCFAAAIGNRRNAKAVSDQNLHLHAAVDNMTQGLCMFDRDGRLVICNKRYLNMYGLSPAIVKPGCSLRTILEHRAETGSFDREEIDRHIDEVRSAIALGREMKIVSDLADGRTILLAQRPMPNGGWVATHEDITERNRANAELQRAQEFLKAIIENVPTTIFVKDARDLRYVLINRAGERLLGIPQRELVGKTAQDVFPASMADRVTEYDRMVLSGEPELILKEHPITTPANGPRLVESRRIAIKGMDGRPKYILGVIEDVTDRKRAEARIAHLAHHDALTELPNRAAFNECLAATIERAAAAGDSFGVMCIDLDRFKEVNDVFGHPVGDQLLCSVSQRMQSVSEGAFVGRLGGDEFVVITANGPQPEFAERLAERIFKALIPGFVIDGCRLQVGVSIGVAIYPSDGKDIGTLMGNADAALYRAKADGRGTIRFFQAEMDKRLRDRRALQHDLRGAITNNELMIDFQPIALTSGEIVGFEALARWDHPTRGLVSPDIFIPIAEESDVVLVIGEWILRETCREAASWPRPLQVAVNLSPAQFRHGDLPELVHSVLLETGLAPERLHLEITEGVLIHDVSRGMSILRRLKSLGVRIAMDDFGTGYSSFAYLQAFPFDKIKIDKSFVERIGRQPQSEAIVRAAIVLGHGLNLAVVAEGVETPEQHEFLSREGCDQVQGYLVGKPLAIASYADVVGAAWPERSRRAAAG
jgi:diguanylate cyclase (GGDEF)-like protein/PAS domain S-box-containing protein